ncbi:gliding motility-associated C-terminal domain-containing protein, partial [Flavobacterium macrobrachii]
QPAQPTLACYETATFNTTSCQWDVTGTQPTQPTLACYETATFNTTTCQWDVTGTQPVQPTLACYETATFNTTTCQWDVTGNPIIVPVLGNVTQPNCSETLGSFNIINYDVNNVYLVSPSNGVTMNGSTVTAPVGTYTVIASFNGCESSTSTEITIAVIPDNTPPVFDQSAPADIEVSCNNIPPMDILTATDNCGPVSVVPDEEIINGDCQGNYLIVRTWTVTDGVNPPVELTQLITVVDNQGPQLNSTVDAVLNVTCDEIPQPIEPSFIDNCSGVLSVTFNETQSDVINNQYSITRTWVAKDNCGNDSEIIEQVINVEVSAETIGTENREICNAAEFDTINLSLVLPNGTPSGGTWINVNNAGGLNGVIFSAFNNGNKVPVGDYTFSYVFDDGTDCPSQIDVIVNVNDDCLPLDCETVFVHNAFTPNGDGVNEHFQIDNINQECHLPNRVEIYNRWGVLVYEADNYDNNTKKFVGISEGRVTVDKNAELPTGTYFYIIQYNDGNGKVISESKYLYLTR